MKNGKKVVLLVEDSEIVREVTRAALEEAGFVVRTAAGSNDLEKQIQDVPGFLDGLDLMVLDMELVEQHERIGQEHRGTHPAVQLTGSQIGIAMPLAHPQLSTVPFLVYSGMEKSELQAYLDELTDFAGMDERIQRTYRGFIPKDAGSEEKLVQKIQALLVA